MEIDIDKQKEAQEKAKKLLAHEERHRAERRLLKLVLDLEKGNSEVLLNDELMENLPDLISTYCQAGNRDRVKVLFKKLGECACSENSKLRERAVMALSLCMEGLQLKEHPDLIEIITRILLRWLRAETRFFSVCSTVCSQLQANGIRMLEEGLWKECDYLLEIFYQIQSGIHDKSNAIRSVVGRAQGEMATDYILEELTLVSLRGRGERRQNAERILIHLGRKAAIHLLDTLLSCQEKEDRLRLIGLIPATGYAAISVLKEYLRKDLPWYGIRNVILMITAMDDEKLIPLIMPCLNHEDIRIQQQVIDCIKEVAEENPRSYLLTALPLVNDELKVGLIGHLGLLGGADIVDAFLDLLAQHESFSSNVRDDLLHILAIQVRLSPSIRAVNLLTMILDERIKQLDPLDDAVSKAALQTLQLLKPHFESEQKVTEAADKLSETDTPEELETDTPNELVFQDDYQGIIEESVSFDGDQAARNPAKRDVQVINDEVTALLGKGKVSEASKLLYDQCIEAAQEKRFEAAEILRDRILEVNPNALAEVINAGERIEEERSTSITSSHISIWQDLYDSLTTEEFNALYYALRSKDFSTGSVIAEQGMNSPLLYFINSGQAKLTCHRGDNEIFLKKIGPGEIIGTGPFFDVSVWTVSLTALGAANVHILKREKFLELLEEFPGIEPCLHDYCLKHETVPELLEMSGEDRRQHPRFPVTMVVQHTLLDDLGIPSTKSFKGEIVDISSGGFSFYIRISRKENARLLLGRGIITTFPIEGGEIIDCEGQIVAVRYQSYVENEYSVHVQFGDPISGDVVKSILNRQ